MKYQRMHSYPAGSRTIGTKGAEKIKTKEGWQPYSRFVAGLDKRVFNGGRELDENDRVFHLDCTTVGQDGHNDPSNLVVVRINREKVNLTKVSRVSFIPKAASEMLLPAKKPMPRAIAA